ncbi:hypothetical protein [Paenibacillus sp. UNC451MF]|uniref:hypothetical protein n=1 Tax=Paenibacillus sp. UNC451MF TaxID=1449063 RepID=UPI0004904738|nr:hypothetical protein [Paenibacillus sp. UNC451MF]
MSILTEFNSIEAFLKTVLPDVTVTKHENPAAPSPHTLLLRLNSDARQSETNLLVRTEREYSLQLWSGSAEETLETLDRLSTALYQTQLIPVLGAARFIRVRSFAFNPTSSIDPNLYTYTGILRTEGRQARTQESYEKIQHVYAQQITL